VVRVGGTRGVDSVLVGSPERKTPFGRRRYRWKDNIKMYLHEVGWGEAWTGLI
jgi:hypothetical protein